MKDLLSVAEEFGRIIWPYKKDLEIKDLMLFGSLTYKKDNLRDVDILILHSNYIFEEFQEIADSNMQDSQKLKILSKKLEHKVNLPKILEGTSVIQLITENKFNAKYMDVKFFTDLNYRKLWIERDTKIHGHKRPRLRLEGERFEDTIFRQGLLWNSQTQKYDLPANQKYQIPTKP